MEYVIPLPVVLAINGGLLILSIVLALIMLNSGVLWTMNPGNSVEQDKHKRVVLRSMMILIFVGLAAAVMNLFFV